MHGILGSKSSHGIAERGSDVQRVITMCKEERWPQKVQVSSDPPKMRRFPSDGPDLRTVGFQKGLHKGLCVWGLVFCRDSDTLDTAPALSHFRN